MALVSIHIGVPRSLVLRTGELFTGGAKAEATSALLRFSGFEGDRAACICPAGTSVALDLYHGRSTDRELHARLRAMPELADEEKRYLAERFARTGS